MTATLIQRVRIWTKLQIWCAFFLLTVVVVALCVRYVDRPICLFADSLFGQFTWIGDLKRSPSLFDTLALLLFAFFLLRRLARRPFSKLDLVCLLGDASLLLMRYANDELKYVFARTYPKWGSPSFLHDGAYRFDFLRHGHDYLSFPSGHTAAVCALLAVLWVFYPRFKALYALTAIGVAVVLVATNYHFLSDVIAGGFVGASGGTLCVSAWQVVDSAFSSLRTEPTENARVGKQDHLQTPTDREGGSVSTLDFRHSQKETLRRISPGSADIKKPEFLDD